MLRSCIVFRTLLFLVIILASCNGTGDPVTPPGYNPDMVVSITRTDPLNPAIDQVNVIVTRKEDGTLELPGRTIEIIPSSGSIGVITDRGDGTYETVWSGSPAGEVSLVAIDRDSDPSITAGITFLALDYLIPMWDVPVKLESPMSTDGWETAPSLYPDGNAIAFSYITLDMVSYSGGVRRSIGEERPGQSNPETMDLYIATRPDKDVWWTGWTVENASINIFQPLPMNISAPTVASDLGSAYCTVQVYNGDSLEPTRIYLADPDFSMAPIALGPPVDMTGLGEDNPYFAANTGWMYFDTYDLGDPLSKQNIWAAESYGPGLFYDPVPLVDLNTVNIETQPFLHEQSTYLYFATDRNEDEFILAIWRAQVVGSFTSQSELVARGQVAMGHPSVSFDEEWFCFNYARIDSNGANADIAMSKHLE